jgi:O-antigen ligase
MNAESHDVQVRGRSMVYENGALTWHEKLALAIGMPEIAIQADKYFFYHEADAALGAVGGFNISPTFLCMCYLYLVWMLNPMAQPVSKRFIIGIPNLVYLAAVALSVVAAQVPILALCDLFLLAQAYAFFFYFSNRIQHYQDLRFCVLVLSSLIALQGIVCIGLAASGGRMLGQEVLLGPISFLMDKDGRTAGTLSSPVLAGSLMALVWLPVLAINLSTRLRKVWWITFAALALGLVGIFLTQTRGAIVTVGIGSTVIGIGLLSRGWLPKWAIQGALIGSVLAAIPLLYVVQKRVLGDDEGSAESRKHLSLIALATIQKSPILGHGAGNCHLACAPEAESVDFRSEWYFTVHSKYLLVCVETGLIGLVSFLWMLCNALRYGLGAWFYGNRPLAILGVALFAAILGHMTHLAVDVFNSRPLIQTLWSVMGIAAAAYRLSLAPQRNDLKRFRPQAQRASGARMRGTAYVG